MVRKLLIAFGAAALFAAAANTGAVTQAMAFGADFAGPGPGITGNNTGGIFPYRPGLQGDYQQVAARFCARCGRCRQGDQHASHLRRLHQLRLLSTGRGRIPLIAVITLSPVADHRLHHRQRRHCRGIGAQDARAERQPHHVRLFEQRRALVLGKTAFGPDQHRKRRLARQAVASAATGLATSASSSQNTRKRAGSRSAR